MTLSGLSLMEQLDALYRRQSDDPRFELVVRELSDRTDGDLADLIEADGRLRVRLDRAVELHRYTAAVPDLMELPVALDAAIEMVLKSMARQGTVDEAAISSLITEYPALEDPIRDAAALSDIVGSTGGVQRRAQRSAVRTLPTPFGPPPEDGGTHRYELRELLGQGAFGQVYLGVDRDFSDKNHPALVAVKVLSGLDRSGQARQLFVDEATKARRISHPNVAHVNDRNTSDDGEDYIVYEFVEGGDLERRIRAGGSMGLREAVTLMTKVARGVHAAHMAGLVHCDLKPNNILMTTDSEPKVADFGVAIRADEQGGWHQAEGDEREPIGNIAYMSPEQYRMEPGSLTIPTDVYALGGILFRLITGQLPNGSTREEIARVHDPESGRSAPPSLSDHVAEVDPDLDRICQRASALLPAHRYDSAAQLARDLEAWLRRESIPWTNPTARRRLGLWVRRAPAAALAVLVLAAVLIACMLLIVAAQSRQARVNAQQKVREFVASLIVAKEAGLTENVLTGLWLSEWLYGPTVLGEGPGLIEIWELRKETIGDCIDAADARGAGNDLQTLIWKTALAFWMIKDGEYAGADDILVENVPAWEAKLDPRDEWLTHLRGMQACVDVQRRLDGDTAPAGDRETIDLAAIAKTLDQLDHHLRSRAPGSPIHLLILEHRRRLHEGDLLDDPALVKAIKELESMLRE